MQLRLRLPASFGCQEGPANLLASKLRCPSGHQSSTCRDFEVRSYCPIKRLLFLFQFRGDVWRGKTVGLHQKALEILTRISPTSCLAPTGPWEPGREGAVYQGVGPQALSCGEARLRMLPCFPLSIDRAGARIATDFLRCLRGYGYCCR